MDNAQEFIPIKKVTKIYGVSSQVLRKWEDAGVLESMRTPGNTRIYNRKTLESALGITRTSSQKRNFCYCRVSSQKQSNTQKKRSFLFSQETTRLNNNPKPEENTPSIWMI